MTALYFDFGGGADVRKIIYLSTENTAELVQWLVERHPVLTPLDVETAKAQARTIDDQRVDRSARSGGRPMTRRAFFDASTELIVSALGLPADTALQAAEARIEGGCPVIRFYVEHSDLADVAEGEPAPRAMPAARLVDGRAEFVGWGQR